MSIQHYTMHSCIYQQYRSRRLLLFQALEQNIDVTTQRLLSYKVRVQRSRKLDDSVFDRLRSECLRTNRGIQTQPVA